MFSSVFVDAEDADDDDANGLSLEVEDEEDYGGAAGPSGVLRGRGRSGPSGGEGIAGQQSVEEAGLDQETRDDAEDAGTVGSFFLAAPRRRQGRRLLTTVGDVLELCRELSTAQLEKAFDLGSDAKPNEAISGDAVVKTAIQTLLPDTQQRDLFLELASNPKTWPRLKPFFGAPPYHFLREQDAGLMRATGMSRGRTHMAYDAQNPFLAVTTIAQFGAGHFVDEHERVYRVLPWQPLRETDALPTRLESAADPSNVLMHVKVPKRPREEKIRLMSSSATKKRCFFPQPGEQIRMTETKRMMTFLNQRSGTEVTCKVKRLMPRDEGSSTAAIVVAVN